MSVYSLVHPNALEALPLPEEFVLDIQIPSLHEVTADSEYVEVPQECGRVALYMFADYNRRVRLSRVDERVKRWESAIDLSNEALNDSGTLELSNGFSVVLDSTSGDERINPSVYTAYFADWKVPVAENLLNAHDMQHLGLFKQLAEKSKLYADTIHAAAKNSLGNLLLEKEFTTAYDSSSDYLLLMEWGSESMDEVAKALSMIRSLVRLATRDIQDEDERIKQEQDIFDQLFVELEIADRIKDVTIKGLLSSIS
ncbi:MAG: hypothetical protein Q7T41_02480 [Candidatus Saccharibacteria bacterium]|nr:hypothetical protein [Candidatus Saccharibacteria bacterium]